MIRSYLFTPAHQDHLVSRAHERGADAVLLDLEDSVPQGQKSIARPQLSASVSRLTERGARVAVRVNRVLDDCVADLDAACLPGVSAVVLPKVTGPDHITLIDEYLSICERKAGLPNRQIKLIALIETPAALLNISQIAQASPRLIALALGTEDLSTECGFEPNAENLFAPSQQLILAARAAGLQAIGLPGSIAEVQDMSRFTQTVQHARRMGYDGVLCIHPKQVAVVNECFEITDAERAAARRIIDAYQDALHKNLGAIQLDGKMLDPPIVARAQSLLAAS